ncbi:hypothetical protein J7E49_24645 [Variovorax paradoxus]|nr:hypothetical protein [Variovorax paradoxus]
MSTDITFPPALCEAQYNIWLHALEFFETAASHIRHDGGATPVAAEVPARTVEAPPSRRAEVNDALRILHAALAAAPSARRHAGRKSAAARRRA